MAIKTTRSFHLSHRICQPGAIIIRHGYIDNVKWQIYLYTYITVIYVSSRAKVERVEWRFSPLAARLGSTRNLEQEIPLDSFERAASKDFSARLEISSEGSRSTRSSSLELLEAVRIIITSQYMKIPQVSLQSN